MKLNMNKGKHEVTFLLLLIAHRLLRNITYIKSGGDFSQLSIVKWGKGSFCHPKDFKRNDDNSSPQTSCLSWNSPLSFPVMFNIGAEISFLHHFLSPWCKEASTSFPLLPQLFFTRNRYTKKTFWAQLFEGRLVLNPGLNLTRVSLSCVQKHFLG